MEPRNEEYGLGGEKERLVCTSPDCPFQRARPEGCKLTKGCQWVLKMRCESFLFTFNCQPRIVEVPTISS